MSNESSGQDVLFEVLTPLGFRVRVTRAYWDLIVTIKHPVMSGREADVVEALSPSRGNPAESQRSQRLSVLQD